MIEETIVFEEEPKSVTGRLRSFVKVMIIPVILWIVLSFTLSSQFVHSNLLALIQKNWKGNVQLGNISLNFPLTVTVKSLSLQGKDDSVTWLALENVEVYPAWGSLFSTPVSVSVNRVQLKGQLLANGKFLPVDKYCLKSVLSEFDPRLEGWVKYSSIPESGKGSLFYQIYEYLPLAVLKVNDGRFLMDYAINSNDTVTTAWDGLNLHYAYDGPEGNPLLLFSMNSQINGNVDLSVNLTPDNDKRKILWHGKITVKDLELANVHSLLNNDLAELAVGAIGNTACVASFAGGDDVPEHSDIVLSISSIVIPLPLGSISADKVMFSLIYDIKENKFVNVVDITGLNGQIEHVDFAASATLKGSVLSVNEMLLTVDSATVMGTGSVNLPPKITNHPLKSGYSGGYQFFIKGENIPLPPADVQESGTDSQWTIDKSARIESVTAAVTDRVVNIETLSYKGSKKTVNFSGNLTVDAGGIVNGTLQEKGSRSSSLGLCGFLWSPSVTLKEKIK